MEITLLVTHDDFSLKNLKHELQNLGLDYRVEYIEDNPELVASHQIRHSPNVFVDGELAFRDQPSPQALRRYLDGQR